MMFRPGASEMSRIFSPPGSFQMTRRLTQRRGPATPVAGVMLRGCGPIRSGCDIHDPALDFVWQRGYGRGEIDAIQQIQNVPCSTIRPPGGVDRLEPGAWRPGPATHIF